MGERHQDILRERETQAAAEQRFHVISKAVTARRSSLVRAPARTQSITDGHVQMNMSVSWRAHGFHSHCRKEKAFSDKLLVRHTLVRLIQQQRHNGSAATLNNRDPFRCNIHSAAFKLFLHDETLNTQRFKKLVLPRRAR